MNKKNKNLKKELSSRYWNEEMSTLDIAKDMDMSKGWVLKKMNMFKIKKRTRREAGLLRAKKEGLFIQ